MPKMKKRSEGSSMATSQAKDAKLAESVVKEATDDLIRTLGHVIRDTRSLVKNSGDPIAVKIRKHSGFELRFERIGEQIERLLNAFYDVWDEADQAAEHDRRALQEFREARVKGAYEKLSKDPTQRAKAEAIRLWPEAHRKGWTADKMWTTLSGAGHPVKADTVRKWMTKLRRTGTC